MLITDQSQPAHKDILHLTFAEVLVLAQDIQKAIHGSQDISILRQTNPIPERRFKGGVRFRKVQRLYRIRLPPPA